MLAPTATNEQRPPRILVVEDEECVRDLLHDLLTLWGYEAETASTGAEGLARLAQDRYDLIVTDHSMPGVTGLDLVRTVRRDDRDVGIIMLTAAAGDVGAHRQHLGFTLLEKPCPPDQLESAVRRALAGGQDVR